MFVRAYLRASTDDQNANRARDQLRAFAEERGLRVAAYYVENESGAKLARPELFRLLGDSHPGDVLLIEQVDRLSRLTSTDWELLRAELPRVTSASSRSIFRPPGCWPRPPTSSPGACSRRSTA